MKSASASSEEVAVIGAFASFPLLHLVTFCLSFLFPAPAPASAAPADDARTPGIEELSRLDRLPAFRTSVRVASVSSYDRTGGNDDGFSGKYSFVRKEPGGLVLADLTGPGVIYRIWTPTPTADLFEFFFDGEDRPRITVPFRDLFTGRRKPFVAPLVGFGAGGFYCYVPLPFAKSCKVVAKAERIQFYQINYAVYPDNAGIASWRADPSPEYLRHQEAAQKLFASVGADISAHVAPPDASIVRHAHEPLPLGPGKTLTLFEADGPGRIVGIRLSPASAFETKDRDLLLRITWDGDAQPAVCCPVGDFFGYAWGRPAMTSLLVGTAGDVNYCYLPMPFDRSAKVELVSQRKADPPVQVRSEVLVAPVPRRPDEGRFYALWRRENPTTAGVPFTFIETQGRGHVVGCILQAQGVVSGNTYFFEGDDQTTIDGELVIHGTGSEDFFNGGWYDVPGRWEKRLSFPLSGCLGYQRPLGRTGGYRFMIGDAYAYRKGIRHGIEHGGDRNSIITDYCGVTFLYSEARPTCDLTPPPPEQRRVVDFTKVIFTAGWALPIHAFTFDKAVLTRRGEKLGTEDVRFLSMRPEGPKDWFGAPFLSLTCDLPAAGMYAVAIEAIKGPAQGIVQLFRDEGPVGEPVDLYAPQRDKTAPLPLGTLRLDEGPNNLMFKLVGKNEKSTGLALDLVNIICEKQ